MVDKEILRQCWGVCAAAVLALLPVPAAAGRVETLLHSFCQKSGCPDGQDPFSAMVQDAAGNLYGTTVYGGNSIDGGQDSAGTIYELAKKGKHWKFRRLYRFCSQTNCTDGYWPYGGLIVDTSGNLYGTTNGGFGTVYELAANGTFRVIYKFCEQQKPGYCADGNSPYAGLSYQGQQTGRLYDGKSTLYGTTVDGGPAGHGVVFSLTPGGSETVLYTDQMDDDAVWEPYAPVIPDSAGNLYGTSYNAGDAGTLFEVSVSGQLSVLHWFCGAVCNHDGAYPRSGGLLMTPDGALFGTTPFGGKGGVIYTYVSGAFAVAATFCKTGDCSSGASPEGSLVMDAAGNLYGVAPESETGEGTVFKSRDGRQPKALYTFCQLGNCADGKAPYSKLVLSNGYLYGTTTQGGAYDGGTVFRIKQ